MKKVTFFSLLSRLFLLVGVLGFLNILHAQVPSLEWAVNPGGGAQSEVARGVAADDSGNVYTVGTFASTSVTIGNQTFTRNGSDYDCFLSKQDAQGNFIWVKQFYSRTRFIGWDIATDDLGYVYISGYFGFRTKGQAVIGNKTIPIQSNADAFCAKFDPNNGNTMWVQHITGGGSSWATGRGIDVDKYGNVYTTGSFMQTTDFDSHNRGLHQLTASNPSKPEDVFIVSYDSAGNFRWVNRSREGWRDQGNAIVAGDNGFIYVAGGYGEDRANLIWFGKHSLIDNHNVLRTPLKYTHDIFVVKMDTGQGNFIWAKGEIGGIYNELVGGIDVDESDNVYITGSFASPTAQFGKKTLTKHGTGGVKGYDAFVAKLDSSGNFMWTNQYGSSSNDQGKDVAADNTGVYATGSIGGKVDFDPGSGTKNLNTNGNADIYLTKINPNGSLSWAYSIGDKGNDEPYAITMNCNYIYNVGYFGNNVDFDPSSRTNILNSNGGNDGYVQKLKKLSVPLDSATSNAPICSGDNLKLKAIGDSTYNYSWAGPNGFSSKSKDTNIANIDISNAGNYIVTVTFGNGCTISDTVKVTVNPFPTIKVTSNSPVCVGDTITLTSTGGSKSSWTGPNGFNSNSTDTVIYPARINNSGNYMVSVTDSNGCSDTASVNIVVNPVPTATASSNSPICEKDSLQLNASGGSSYNWTGPNNYSSTEQNPTIASADPSASGDYIVTVSDSSGCGDAKDTVHVTVNKYFSKNCHTKLEIPNVFTPNGDGKNDVFKITGLSLFPGTKVLIFDRWGRERYMKVMITKTTGTVII